MNTRTLGTHGPQVSALGYGSMGTATGYGPTNDIESIAAIRRAHDLGVTLFDTAEMYGWGEGEKLLGQAVAPFRDQIVIASKFGLTQDGGRNSRPEHVREVLDNSLRHLGTDTIDIFYQHRPDPQVPVEDVVGTLKELVEAGKIRYIGLSEAEEDDIRRAHAVHPITVLQSEYSLFTREVEPLLPVLEELGIGFVAYSPLARGFLTGAVKPRSAYAADDFRQWADWWAPEHYDANARMVQQLTALATDKGVTLSQLALAWLLARRDDIVPIPGSRNPERVAQNIAAADIDLNADDLAQIDAIIPDGGHGSRMK